MILIVVKNKVREKYADDWPELVAEFTAGSRAEPGCISFEWFRAADDPNEWLLVEVFRDAAAGEAHVQSEHFAKASNDMRRWLAAVPQIIHIEGEGDGWGAVGEA